MSKITTEDCKDYLVKFYKDKGAITQEKDWKRTKKYKNDDGLWVRDFNHAGIGNISLLESRNGLLSLLESNDNNSSTLVNSHKIKSFDLTVFSPAEIKKAWDVYKKYYDDDDENEYPGGDEFIEKHDQSIRSIPGILNWCIVPDAYENYELDGKNISWNFNMKGYNIFMFDNKNYHEYGGDEHLLQKYLPKYLRSMDEYHYEITKDITVEELVRDLSILGYTHVNSHVADDCVLKKLMKNVNFNKIPFAISQIAKDIISGDIKKYSIEDLNTKKINNQSIAMYVFNNKNYDIFNYLLDNKIELKNSDISFIITNEYTSFYEDKERLNCIMRVLLEYENIQIDKQAFENMAYMLQHSNQNELLLSLLPKYANQDNILSFVSYPNISTDINVLPQLIKRFSQHDEELKHWIESYFISGENFNLLENKMVRDTLTRSYITSILDEHYNSHLESLQYEAKRSSGGFMIIEQYRDGTSESWLDQKTRNVAQFIQLKAKILSYFDKNDNENNQKPKYRTKF